MKQVDWEEFKRLRGHEKRPHFEREGEIFHVIMAQQFNRAFLDRICALATKIRKVARTHTGARFLKGLLDDKRAMLYFVQPSTRTFLSFNSACQILGLDILEVRDPSISSEKKGETQDDSVRTFSSYCDLVIMRHAQKDFSEKMAWMMNFIGRPVPIINAGSGKDQHPTQALLDIYTLHRSFENYTGIDGINIALVGDLLRGRTVRSLSYLMKHYEDVKIYFVAPPELQVADDIKHYLRENGIFFEEGDNLAEVIPLADAVYMTRIQDEWDQGEEPSKIDYSRYCFKPEYLELLKPNAVILHPLPRRAEIPPEIDNDKRAMYWRQTRNGMWVRAALIAIIFRKDKQIVDY